MSLTIRPLYYYLLGFSLFLLGTSFVLQFHYNLEPCPLCIIARVLVMVITLFFIVALCHNPKKRGQQIYSAMGFVIALLGVLTSLRHIWLIHLPPEEVPACGPGLQYLFDTLPLNEALVHIFQGSGECAVKNSFLFGLSIPGWTLIGFIVLGIGCLLPLWGTKRKSH